MVSYIFAVIAGLAVLGLDQWSKAYIVAHYVLGGESQKMVPGLLNITYIHNDGGAWGMLSGYTWILLSVTLLVMLICIALLIKVGTKNKLLFWAVCLVFGGGVGNMIDRIFRGGKVVDFIQFDFFKQFPVFNVADCGVVLGAALLVLYFVIGMIRDSKNGKSGASAADTENGDH